MSKPQDTKMKKYIDTDVYTESKNRIKHIIHTFDKLYVCFSGGKDSLAVLHLVEEVYEELGIAEKINVIFRDEELIPDDVIEFVQSYYHSGKYNFYYYAVPLKSTKFILGKTYEYIQWDDNREWIREKPSFAITLKEGDNRVFDQYTMDAFCVEGVKGKIAFLTGIRADESLVRLNSCVVKKNENYINATKTPQVKLCKPIYDWSQDDIFLYFYKKNIKYCGIYDLQIINKDQLRVATPLHAESAKRFGKLKTLYPMFYQQLVNVFPEMLVQEMYWDDFDRYAVAYQYPHTWQGIIDYIDENIEDRKQAQLAIKKVLTCKKTRENKLAKGEGTHNMGGYPLLYVFKCILAGQYKRELQPTSKASQKDFEYEGMQLVSVYCLVIAKHKARFKSNYTLPTYRRRGYLTLFIKHAKEICKANGIKEMTAFCTPLSIGSHLKNGAEIKSHKGDIAFIKYII